MSHENETGSIDNALPRRADDVRRPVGAHPRAQDGHRATRTSTRSGALVPQPELPTTMPAFWALAKDAISTATHMVDHKVRALESANLVVLQRILIQYRWFTSYYAGDLALLISKLPPSGLRSELGGFLHEELGMGDAADTHPVMYDRFLVGLGVDPARLEKDVDAENISMLEHFRQKMWQSPYMYGVGLKAMGAECLCQVYLQAIHHHLMRNPGVQKRKHQLDWKFWDIHASEADQMHGEKTRQYIERLATPENIPQLATGYLDAERLWRLFWDNSYAAASDQAARPALDRVPLDGLCFDSHR